MITVTTNTRFLCGTNLTGFQKQIHNVMMQNELREGYGAYKISHAQKANSGYSFGPVQWDILNDHDIDEKTELTARTLFTDIITNAKDAKGETIINETDRQNIKNKVETKGGTLTPAEQYLVNRVLCSNYGVTKVHEAYLLELNNKVIKIETVINEIADPSLSRTFLQTDFGKLFIADFYNQFGPIGQTAFESYIRGEEVSMYDGSSRINMQLSNELTVKSLMDFYLHTQYAQQSDGIPDLLKRFSNVVESTGIINASSMLTAEDKAYLQDLKNANATAFADARNLGLRTLTVIDKINTVIDGVNDLLKQAYLRNSDMAAYIIGDIKYRFGDKITDEMLQRYFNGEQITLPNGQKVQINGDLGFEDLCRLYMKLPDNKIGLIQKLSDMIEAIGVENIRLTSDDAKFLTEELSKLLGTSRYEASVVKNIYNWGIRDLTQKAVEGNSVSWFINGLFNKISNAFNTFRQLFTLTSTLPIFSVSPIILDLDGNGIETINVKDGAYFDHGGNGFAEQTGWASSGEGFLVMDRNEDGIINDGKEFFGSETLLSNGTKAANGFQALVELDDNQDGKIDANDPIWSQLKIWQHDPEATDIGDPDTSGIMKTLDEIGIKAIYLDSTITNITDSSGNTETRTGNFELTDGRTGTVSEYRLQRDTSDAIATEYLEVSPEIAVLPDLQGYGNVYSLHQAMVNDIREVAYV